MIRLKSLLTEISLNTLQPYATRFTWESVGRQSSEVYEARFAADDVEVVMTMLNGGHNEWYFAFLMPTASGRYGTMGSGRTTSHARSEAPGQLNYLRIIRTAGEAIMDFCNAYSPEAVNISGADSDTEKRSQKTRLYAAFVRDNAAELAAAGYTSMQRDNELWLVRQSAADATGIKDK